jgi:hypothetical protein
VLTSKGSLPLIEIQTNPTADQLQRALEVAIPAIEQLLGHEYVLLHDLSSAFTAKSTQEYLQQHVPSFFSKEEYPGNSPDINCIENVIGHTKRLVSDKRPRNTTELVAALNEAWYEATSPKHVEALYASMTERMEALVRAKGGNTRF